MNLTSLFDQGEVFWRTFDAADALYVVGLAEGVLRPGEGMNFTHDSGLFQMEVKRGTSTAAPTIVRPGPAFRNDATLLLDADGSLVKLTDQLQAGWRWCKNCDGLFFSGGQPTAGVCPAVAARGPHDGSDSGKYVLAHNTRVPSGQSNWRWCTNCSGLFHATAQGDTGVCPSGRAAHVKGISGDYALTHDDARVAGQSKWRWCHKCGGLFFAGTQATTGKCPADLGEHDSRPSGDYTVMTETIETLRYTPSAF